MVNIGKNFPLVTHNNCETYFESIQYVSLSAITINFSVNSYKWENNDIVPSSDIKRIFPIIFYCNTVRSETKHSLIVCNIKGTDLSNAVNKRGRKE